MGNLYVAFGARSPQIVLYQVLNQFIDEPPVDGFLFEVPVDRLMAYRPTTDAQRLGHLAGSWRVRRLMQFPQPHEVVVQRARLDVAWHRDLRQLPPP